MVSFFRLLILCATALFCTGAVAQNSSNAWYSAEVLNEGLGPAPENLNRSTPRAAMRAFVEYARADRFEAAAHVLNLAMIEPGRQPDRAVRVARQLYQVIDRRVWVDWSDLPARPDAKVEQSASEGNAPGEVRRDLGIKLFDLNGRAYEIRIARYKAGEDSEPVWLFTPQTGPVTL